MKELLRSPWVRLGLLLLVFLVALWGFSLLAAVLTPFAIAFALAYFLNPPVNAMERFFAGDIQKSRLFRGRLDPRTAAVAILCVGVALLVSLVVALVVPAAWHQAADAASKLPGYLQTLRARLEPVYERLNLRYPEQAEEVRQHLEATIRDNAVQILKPLTRAIQVAFSSLLDFVLAMLNLLVVPVFTVYLLYDMNHINQGFRDLVPHRNRGYVYSRFAQVDRLLSAFVRGQLTVAMILGVFYSIGLSICGMPMGLLIGFVIGLFNLVPFMSYILGLPLALLLSWLDDQDPRRLLAVAGVFVLGQFVEGNFITPRIVGGSLGLHAVVIMLAVLVGGTTFGFVGMVVAVPATAALSVFWADLRDRYLGSAFYRGDDPVLPPGAPPLA